MTQRLFIFNFGTGNYDTQNAVVLAETPEEARELLVADLSQQGAAKRLAPSRPSPVGERGLQYYYHNLETLRWHSGELLLPVAEHDGPVVYTYGVDG